MKNMIGRKLAARGALTEPGLGFFLESCGWRQVKGAQAGKKESNGRKKHDNLGRSRNRRQTPPLLGRKKQDEKSSCFGGRDPPLENATNPEDENRGNFQHHKTRMT